MAASDFNLKYLHPSVKTYITTENNQYDTTTTREVLFVADVFEHGKDNVLQEVNTVSEYLFKYGDPDFDRFGQAGYNVEKWLTSGNTAIIMRLLPEDASYAHAVFNVQYKNTLNGKSVVSSEGEEVKINDVYLRPVVTYIGVNNTSEKLMESELSEDRSGYPTTDGYIDNFIFAVYPEGRGEYYNDLGFRIRLNTSYDTTLTSRVYTFEVIKYTGTTYDIVDGPFYVSFDPDAIDPNSKKSMYIENVINSYAEYIKVKVNTENYLKLATNINPEVDPYIIDVITGKSRILEDGNPETYYCEKTGRDEDVHISLHKYSSTGISLKDKDGNYLVNISNNDETTSDIVNIADNARKVIYNNQKYVTQYMRGFYNWLMQNRIQINLNKIMTGTVESNYNATAGLLTKKVDNLIFANYKNEDPYSYVYDYNTFLSDKVGKYEEVSQKNYSWYLRTQEILSPGLKSSNGAYVGTAVNSGYENRDETYISTEQVCDTITEDGFIEKTKQHLISYYHNFKKYMGFVMNYDAYNNSGFVISDKYNKYNKYALTDVTDYAWVGFLNYTNNSFNNPLRYLTKTVSGDTTYLVKSDIDGVTYNNIYDFIFKNIYYHLIAQGGWTEATYDYIPQYDGTVQIKDTKEVVPIYVDESLDEINYLPIIDNTTYDEYGNKNIFGSYIKITNLLGEEKLQAYKATSVGAGSTLSSRTNVTDVLKTLVNKYLYKEASEITSLSLDLIVVNSKKPSKNAEEITLNVFTDGTNAVNRYSFEDYRNFLRDINTEFNDLDFSDYVIGFTTDGQASTHTNLLNLMKNYTAYTSNSQFIRTNRSYNVVSLVQVIRFLNDILKISVNSVVHGTAPGNSGKILIPGDYINVPSSDLPLCDSTVVPLTTFSCEIGYENLNDTGYGNAEPSFTAQPNISAISDIYFKQEGYRDAIIFNNVFSEKLKIDKLTNCFNKVYAYANLISKELDGKGEETIVNDIQTARNSESLDYTNYSLTTILNLLIGGFEAIVNNQGSITDYTNYSSLKYMMRTIRNKLDLRTTYLTLLNLHKNKVLDLSIDLAKNNATVVLGDETLNLLYGAMDDIVIETNYLINIINTILNRTYTIYNLVSFDKVSTGKPYAYYFSTSGVGNRHATVDPLGITINMSQFGKKGDLNRYTGILPILETILINITGENHYGETRNTLYGGTPLIEIYDNIVNGYTVDGLTQEKYESIYQVLAKSLENLSNVHNMITAFINDKYISEIVDTLLGAINVNSVNISYKGINYTVNSLWEYYNSGVDEELTQIKVINMINDALDTKQLSRSLPITNDIAQTSPVIMYSYFCISDILDSIDAAKENKNIVKNNIIKQDHVLSSLNTLCYDNLVTDITMPLGFAEGSDGCFTYDDSSRQALKIREHKINDIRIKAYKGTWNEDVINKDMYEFDHVIDANYPDAVKNAIITLARDERQDFFFWADTMDQNTVQDTLNWKETFTNSTYFMSIISQSQTWYDEYTSKNINLTSTYLIADMLGRHIDSFGRHFPMAGSRRGVVGGFTSCDWYPNEEQKEKLYKNRINYIERDPSVIRIGAQNTNYPAGPLGQINNMLVVLRIKRVVEKIAKTYQFEFNTIETRNKMAAEINAYLKQWIDNGACTLATSNVYASDYDIMQKIVRVDIILKFTGVIERIVINIDCPASL